ARRPPWAAGAVQDALPDQPGQDAAAAQSDDPLPAAVFPGDRALFRWRPRRLVRTIHASVPDRRLDPSARLGGVSPGSLGTVGSQGQQEGMVTRALCLRPAKYRAARG